MGRGITASCAEGAVLLLTVFPLGCRGPQGASDGEPSSDSSGPDEPGEPECVGLECAPCAESSAGATWCADAPDVDDTCCAVGDPLVQLARAGGSEVVDAITNGRYAVGCGGFGAVVSNVEDPTAPVTIGTASDRCQNAAFGPLLPSGEQVLYVTHHGDSWVASPSLQTYRIAADGQSMELGAPLVTSDILYEGLTVAQGMLYVTAHARGLLVYTIGDAGEPSLVGEVGGFGNAVEVASDGAHLYVADREQGVVVLSLDEPESPARLGAYPTVGIPRDIDIDDGRVYVALGTAGVDVFEADGVGSLEAVGHVNADGAVQQVDAEGELLAVAAWSHAAIYDTATLNLVATERTRPTPQFEQDLGVAVYEDLVFVGEWEDLYVLRHEPGQVAPDLLVEQGLLEFDAVVADTVVLVMRNRGALPLSIIDVAVSGEGFSVDAEPVTLEPGAATAFEVTHDAGGPPTAVLEILSNDPDEHQIPHVVPLDATESDRLDVGDAIGPDFSFLDLEGNGDVENLRGQVVVLAYFALF